MINTKMMRYTGKAVNAFNASIQYDGKHDCRFCQPKCDTTTEQGLDIPRPARNTGHGLPTPRQNIGTYPLTSKLALWVHNAVSKFKPDSGVQELVKPYSKELHKVFDAERLSSKGLHDLDLIERIYQAALKAAAAVILSANTKAMDDPDDISDETHSSRAGGDEEFEPWGKLLTGVECDPPIISIFPFYLMMCQAFTFEPISDREHYVYAALTGIDWARARGPFRERLTSFKERVNRDVPKLHDKVSRQDRSFWRTAHGYLSAVNACENLRPFRTPSRAAIPHPLDIDLILAMRGLDTIGTAFMRSDGAAWLDDEGFGSLIGSALPNDVMDLHTDIKTGETRNLLRLLYPDGLHIEQAKRIMSTILSSLLCEMYRAHYRARYNNREDGRIVATSPPYSLCRARHRKIFETLETYIGENERFWEWHEEIYKMAKGQVTEAGLQEPLVCALKRSREMDMELCDSPISSFYDSYYELVEAREPLTSDRPLGVSEKMSHLIHEIHHLWHIKLRAPNKEPGWGRRFDMESDKLFGDAGRMLSGSTNGDKYKFAIAYGRLCTALPYVAYHTVAAIIMTRGVTKGGN